MLCRITYFAFGLLLLAVVAQAATGGNSRCKCLCALKQGNQTTYSVIVNSEIEAEQCKCSKVVPQSITDCELVCRCGYKNRNTTVIQVIVIGLITLVSGLFIYMLFLLCLDPLINRRVSRGGRSRLVEADDGVHMEDFRHPGVTPNNLQGIATDSVDEMGNGGAAEARRYQNESRSGSQTSDTRSRSASVMSILRHWRTSQSGSVSSESRSRSATMLRLHERWQGQLQNQRHNVYSDRSILN